MMRALWAGLLLAGGAWAGTVHGTVKLGPAPRTPEALSGYWRVENGIVPVLPPDTHADAVVVLEPATPPHGDPPTVTVELHGLKMDPRVIAVPVGATVQFKNDDRLPHTLYIEHGSAMMPPEPTPSGQMRTQKFLAAGEYPIRDEEFPHLSGTILAVASQYSATVDANGSFKLEAPEGKYTARVWWRGAWVLSQPVTVGKGELTLVVPSK